METAQLEEKKKDPEEMFMEIMSSLDSLTSRKETEQIFGKVFLEFLEEKGLKLIFSKRKNETKD